MPKQSLFWYPPGCCYALAEILSEQPDERGYYFVRFIESNTFGCYMSEPKEPVI